MEVVVDLIRIMEKTFMEMQIIHIVTIWIIKNSSSPIADVLTEMTMLMMIPIYGSTKITMDTTREMGVMVPIVIGRWVLATSRIL